MDNLIDFNTENCLKLSSPLIPPPQSTPTISAAPRLSDVCNNPFDRVLRTIENKYDPFEYQIESTPKRNLKNNSFSNDSKENVDHLISPIQTPSRKLKKHKQRSNSFDSIFFEANRLADIFNTLSEQADTYYEDISQCVPPWIEEDIIFDDDEEEISKENNNEIIKFKVINLPYDEKQNLNSNTSNVKEEENVSILKNKKQILKSELIDNIENKTTINSLEDNEIKTTKELLHNLKAILNNSGSVTDRKKLGENLLNSLALALDIENPSRSNSPTEPQSTKLLERSKSDSRINLKNKTLDKEENKKTVPKVAVRTAAPIKFEKNLKVKNEKERSGGKGPLKAFIPLTNMAKNKKSISPKNNDQNSTPLKQTHLKIKTQNVKNDSKYMLPMAQSTPEIPKVSETGIKKKTPILKRQFGVPISPLGKQLSASDARNDYHPESNLNKSVSNLTKLQSTSSIPALQSMTRRNSVSDMSTLNCSRNKSNTNDELCRSISLKRNYSFQNKVSTASATEETLSKSNTFKKYGLPGQLKSLKLVPKAKNS